MLLQVPGWLYRDVGPGRVKLGPSGHPLVMSWPCGCEIERHDARTPLAYNLCRRHERRKTKRAVASGHGE